MTYTASKYTIFTNRKTITQKLPANVEDTGDTGSIPGWRRSPGEGNDNPFQYSCLKIQWTEVLGRLKSMGSQRVGPG